MINCYICEDCEEIFPEVSDKIIKMHREKEYWYLCLKCYDKNWDNKKK